MKKLIIFADEKFQTEADQVQQTLKKLEKVFDLKNKAVEVYLVGDSFMQKNVFSFPAPVDFPRPDLKNYQSLGEIYLNPGYIKEHNENFVFMLIHGFLHLLGYDHKIKEDAVKMEEKEQAILRQLNDGFEQ